MRLKLFRFATVAVSMSLMFSLGSIVHGSTPVATPPSSPSSFVLGNPADAPALDLRAVGSQLVVETIEDALRQGGLALFEEGFQLDSSLNWVFGETIEGEVDVVVPLWNGGGRVIFAQPGFVFWTGLEEEERTDANLGLVYRTTLANTPLGVDAVGGASLFYDYDFKNGHGRAGFGADIQSGIFHGAFNYYHPLTNTQDGREGFIEDALRGVDFRLALEREAMRVSANLGYWRFEGDEEVKGDWRSSYGFDAGIRIVPGVFLEGGWERHDETVSLDRRWNAGLAFRFSLPGFEGASYSDGGLSSNLWKPVEREKRILYEERLGIPQVSLTAMTARIGEPAAGGSETAVVMADLGKALEEDVTLHIMVAETSTATLGTDFTYGHKVYELDTATGEQSAPSGDATPCPEVVAMACEVMIPAGVTRFDIEADIAMTTESEIPEFIDFQIEVPEEHADLLRGSIVERVVIEAHDNEVRFATNAVTTLAEDNERTGVEVSVSVDKPSPTPITLNVATDGTATVNEDYRISTRSLTIPANASSASLTLWGINNDRGEGSKSIVLTLSGNLPEGWTITDDEHTVTLQDDDLSIFFTDATTSSVDEPGTGSNADVTVTVGITQAPTANITVRVAAGGTGETATPGSSMDYTFTGMDFTFPADSTASQTATFSVHPDNVAEGDEFIVLTLADDSTNSRDAEGSGFSLGIPHTITIPANDNTVGFASSSATTLAENNTTTGVAVRVEVVEPAPADITLNVSTASTSTPAAVLETHYRISTTSLRIPAGESSGTITLTGINNDSGDGSRNIVLTISSNNLPDGWAITDNEHTVTLQDDDLSVGFEGSSFTIDEPGTDTDHTVNIRISSAPAEDVTLKIIRDSGSTADTTGSNIDVTFSPAFVTFTGGDSTNLTKTVTFNVKHDDIKEPAEYIEVMLVDDGTTLTDGENDFSLGTDVYRLTINGSDNTVSIDTSMSDSTLGENGGTADVVVSVDEPSPTPITLNVSAATTSTALSGDYTLPSTLTIPANSSTGTLTITGVNDDDEVGSLTIDLQFTGSLPTNWAFDPSGNMLTHQITILDDDLGIAGWVSPTGTYTTGSGDYTVSAMLSRSPNRTIELGISFSGTARRGSDFFVPGSANACSVISWPKDASEQDLEQSCVITINASAAGKTIIMTLGDSANHLMLEGGFSTTPVPADHTITVSAPPSVSIDSSASNNMLDENGGTANVVVSVNEPSPTPITLNVSAATTSTATEGTHYQQLPGTLEIGANQNSATLTLTGIDNSTVESTPLTIDLEFTGTLPSGYNFSPSDPLTYQVTIDDNEETVGWTLTEVMHTAPQFGQNMYTATVEMSASPSKTVTLTTDFGGTGRIAEGGPREFFNPNSNSCETIEFAANATGNGLTKTCNVGVNATAGLRPQMNTLTMTLEDNSGTLDNNFVIQPATLTITAVAP